MSDNNEDNDEADDVEIRGLGGESLAGFSSLQKYRPCNYDLAPAPKDSDDINDLRDYYANLATRTRAISRVYNGSTFDGGAGGVGNYAYSGGRRGSRQMSLTSGHSGQYIGNNENEVAGGGEHQDPMVYHNQQQQQQQPYIQDAYGHPQLQTQQQQPPPPEAGYGVGTFHTRGYEPDFLDT